MNKVDKNWFIATLEYASYNSILLIPMLIGIKKYVYKNAKQVALLSTAIFLVLAILLYFILKSSNVSLENFELPLIHVVKQYGSVYKYIYGGVIVSAIYTSAIAAGYSFVFNCSKSNKVYKKICLFLCITAVFVSRIGFSKLVNFLYPVFGILGLVQIVYILFGKRLEKNEEN